jgi:hypothetical protein
MNIAELSPEERLIAEQVVLNLRTLNSAADAAVDGAVFAIAEKLALLFTTTFGSLTREYSRGKVLKVLADTGGSRKDMFGAENRQFPMQGDEFKRLKSKNLESSKPCASRPFEFGVVF